MAKACYEILMARLSETNIDRVSILWVANVLVVLVGLIVGITRRQSDQLVASFQKLDTWELGKSCLVLVVYSLCFELDNLIFIQELVNQNEVPVYVYQLSKLLLLVPGLMSAHFIRKQPKGLADVGSVVSLASFVGLSMLLDVGPTSLTYNEGSLRYFGYVCLALSLNFTGGILADYLLVTRQDWPLYFMKGCSSSIKLIVIHFFFKNPEKPLTAWLETPLVFGALFCYVVFDWAIGFVFKRINYLVILIFPYCIHLLELVLLKAGKAGWNLWKIPAFGDPLWIQMLSKMGVLFALLTVAFANVRTQQVSKAPT